MALEVDMFYCIININISDTLVPVNFIAEVSSNHNQSIERCYQFIDQSASIGCNAVKFQLFRIDQLFAPEILKKNSDISKRSEWELPIEYLPLLSERCHKKGVAFGCTPFDIEAVRILEPYVDFFKIASYELLWHDLISACCTTQKPLILSTGMATMIEIKEAVEVSKKYGCSDLSLLHCISGYPTPLDQCNLAAIKTLRESTNVNQIGWSDHSVSPIVLNRAINHWGASIVEFHLDLEGEGEEFKSGHCWLPEQIKPIIESVKLSKQIDGTGDKGPVDIEKKERDWRADPKDGLRPLKHIRATYEV